MWNQAADLTGQRFGLLVVLERAAPNTSNRERAHWLCRCDCGEQAVKLGKYLTGGDTTSCGCVRRNRMAKGNTKHGGATGGLTREYRSWRDAKQRCHNPHNSKHKFYGARGISMCDEWRNDFGQFLRDMGPCPAGLTLDRIDFNGPYAPHNCRWATWEVQRANKRPRVRQLSRHASASHP